MKTRTDFVSNSSSSSFILADSPIWDAIKVTKQDVIDALVDMYGKDAYDKFIDDHLHGYERSEKKKGDQWMNDDNYKNCKPFYVYDMTNEADRKEAIKEWHSALKGWVASNCHLLPDGKIQFGNTADEYDNLVEAMRKVFNINIYDICSVDDIKNAKMWIRSSTKEKNGCYGHDEDAPQFLKDTLLDARKKCGIIDNAEVLSSPYCKFFVHFEENEAWNGKAGVFGKNERKYEVWDYDVAKGRTDWNPTKKEIDDHNAWVRERNDEIEKSSYDSDAMSGERVMEILYNWFIKIGKLNPIDEKLLECYGKDNRGEWYTANGKSFTYHDLYREMLTACWHEG